MMVSILYLFQVNSCYWKFIQLYDVKVHSVNLWIDSPT